MAIFIILNKYFKKNFKKLCKNSYKIYIILINNIINDINKIYKII